MAHQIRRVDFVYVTVRDRPGEAFKLLSMLADSGINLLGFSAVPTGPTSTQLTLIPEDVALFRTQAQQAGIPLEGPYPALLVQGEDVIGALSGIHEKLYDAGVNVYASSAVTSSKGTYGYILYVRPEEYDRAAEALGT